MLTLGTYNIYCEEDDLSKLIERFIVDKENYLKVDDITNVQMQFDMAIRKSLLEWHKYKIGDDIAEIAKRVRKQFTQNHPEGFKFLNEYRTIGNLKGSILMVGDRYGDKLLPPLIPFGNNMPGLNFFHAIEKSKVDWKDIIITNATKRNEESIDDKTAMLDELSLPNLKTVICLGNNSYDFVSRMSVGKDLLIKKIPHPSAAFVYNNSTVEEYAERINNVF